MDQAKSIERLSKTAKRPVSALVPKSPRQATKVINPVEVIARRNVNPLRT